MKAKLKRILNLLLIFGTLAIVLIFVLRGRDLGQALSAVQQMRWEWIAACLGCYFLFIAADGLSILHFLKSQGYRISVGYSLFISLAGQYYSGITPGASGGQPMQIYYLHQRYVSGGVATSALITRFFSFQIMLSILGTAFWIGNSAFVAEHVGGNMWILLFGFIYNTVICVGLVALVLVRPVVRWAARQILRIGSKLRLIRDPEATGKHWTQTINTFHESISVLVSHPAELVAHLAMGGVQLLALMSIIWCIYRGLGLTEASWGQLVTLYIMEYLSAAWTPLPGASGAQEGVFSIYFGGLFGEDLEVAGLLLWRFFTYYFSLFIGAAAVIIHGLRSGETIREVAAAGEQVQENSFTNAGK